MIIFIGTSLFIAPSHPSESGLSVHQYTGASSGTEVSVTAYYWESGMSKAIPFDTIRASVSHSYYDAGERIQVNFSNSYICSNPPSGMPPNSVGKIIFSYSASSGENIPTYYANVSYNPDNVTTSSYHNISLMFSNAFVFQFKVELTNSGTDTYSFQNQSSLSSDIFVSNDPSVSLSSSQPSPGKVDAGENITFNGQVTGGTSPYSFQWAYAQYTATGIDLSPISGATGESFSTSFSVPGTYNITLCLRDATGYSTFATPMKEVVAYSPKLALTSSKQSTDIGHEITFYANASGGNGNISILWFLNSTSISNSGKYYNRTFSYPGTYTVSAHAEDEADQWANASIVEYVYGHISSSIQVSQTEIDMGQTVNFKFFPEGSTGEFIFENYSLFDNTTDTSLISGEGSQFNFTFPSYASASYDVFLLWSAVSSNFARTSSSVKLSIHDDPSVSVSTDHPSNDVNLSVALTANGAGNAAGPEGEYGGWPPYSFVWMAEDISNSSGWHEIGNQSGYSSSISVSFAAPGTYDVYVEVEDSAGYEVNSSYLSLTIYPQLKANLSADPSEIIDLHCSALKYSEETLSYSGGGPSACGVFQDSSDSWTTSGTPASEYHNMIYVPQTPGYYTFKAYVQNKIGDRAYASTTIHVLPYDMTDEIHAPSEVIAGEAVALSGAAQAPSSYSIYAALYNEYLYFSLTGFNYSWNISGHALSGRSVSYLFQKAGTVQVSLTVRAEYIVQIRGIDKTAYQQRTEQMNITVLNSSSSNDIRIKEFKIQSQSSYNFLYWVSFKNGSYAESLITIGNTTEEPSSTIACTNGSILINETIIDSQYSPGSYLISLTVINNLGQENTSGNQTFVISVAQSDQFSIYSIANFFGGFYNFLIFIATIGGLAIGYASLRDSRKPPVLQVPGKNGKIELYQLSGKKVK